jgi:hypothetical protein
MPGYYMSNLEQAVRPGEDGTLTWALPVGKDAKFPLIDTKEDTGKSPNRTGYFAFPFDRPCSPHTGKFVKAIIKNRSSVLGARILGAAGYYTPTEILDQLSEVTDKKTQFMQVDENTYKSFFPEFIAQEFLENHLFVEKPGYYAGESLEKSHSILEEKLVSWKEYVAKSKVFSG